MSFYSIWLSSGMSRGEGWSIIYKLRNGWSRVSLGMKSAVVYTLATVFTRGLAIITTPIFTRLMTTQDIGIVNLFNMWYALISSVSTLSLTSGGFAVAMKEYPDQRDQYESSVLTLTSVTTLVLTIIYIMSPSFWDELLGLPTTLAVLILVGCFVAPARDFWLARQRYEYKYKLAAVVSAGTALAAAIVSVIVVIYMNKNERAGIAQGRLFGNYIIIFGVALLIWFYVMGKGRTFINKSYWKMSLSLSIPLVGYQIASQILSASDRIMISRMVNNSAVGIYATLYTVSSLSLLVWNAINASFVPYLFQNMAKSNNNVKRVATQLLSIYAMIAIVLTYLAPEIVRILATDEYYEAIYIMPPIAAGIFFTSVSHMYSNIAVYYKKTNYVMYPTIVAAAVNVILNLLFIPAFGYMAAAYTTMVSYVLLGFLQAIFSNRLHKKKSPMNLYDDKAIVLLSVITVVTTLFALVLYQNTILRYMIVIVLLFIALYIYRHKRKI